MPQESLLAYIVPKFVRQQENLATEALHYVLARSDAAQSAFLRLLALEGTKLPQRLSFETQVSGDGDSAIPDLVGRDENGQSILIGEAKFWAPLTENQPVTYINRLPENVDSILLFIAPARRFSTLWSELVLRCKAANVVMEQHAEAANSRSASLGARRWLMLVSWNKLLESIRRGVEVANELSLAADVAQLEGLCARMDQEEFLPLQAEELSGTIGLRIYQFGQLIETIIERCAEMGFGKKMAGVPCGLGYFGRNVKLHDVDCVFFFSSRNWSRFRATPLWLAMVDQKGNWKFPPETRRALLPLELEYPSRLVVGENGEYIPLFLPTGVEKQAVVCAVAEQLRQIAELLRSSVPASRTDAMAGPKV